MAKIQDLPSGSKFSAKQWQKKFKEGTRSGDLHSLQDNQEALQEIAKKRQGAIRRGDYDAGRRSSDYREVLKMDENLTGKEKKYVKDILDHWGTAPTEPPKASDVKKDNSASKTVSKGEQMKKQLRPNPHRELPSFLQRGNRPSAFGDFRASQNSSPYGSPTSGPLNPSSPASGAGRPGGFSSGNYFSNSIGSGGSPKPPSPPKPPRLSV